jgi:hypothetical protein
VREMTIDTVYTIIVAALHCTALLYIACTNALSHRMTYTFSIHIQARIAAARPTLRFRKWRSESGMFQAIA